MDRWDPECVQEALDRLLHEVRAPVASSHIDQRAAERLFESTLWRELRARLRETTAPPELESRIRRALLQDTDWKPWDNQGAG